MVTLGRFLWTRAERKPRPRTPRVSECTSLPTADEAADDEEAIAPQPAALATALDRLDGLTLYDSKTLTPRRPVSVAWAWKEVCETISLAAGAPAERGEDPLDEDVVRAHKNAIAEEILTLHCPECGMAFLDFTCCFALWCARCSCAFCAYCQQSCRHERNDAHEHVMSCEHNIAPGRSIFASLSTFNRAQNLRRIRAIAAYVGAIEPRLREAVLLSLDRSISDLGIALRISPSSEATLVVERAPMPKRDSRTWSGRLGPSAASYDEEWSPRDGYGADGEPHGAEWPSTSGQWSSTSASTSVTSIFPGAAGL